jgi:hypothetical protein
MHKRPKLAEAIQALTSLANISTDAAEALQQYHEMRAEGLDFEACRMVVDIIDHHYHILDTKGIAHG